MTPLYNDTHYVHTMGVILLYVRYTHACGPSRFFLACAFPLSQRYRMRFGSVTLGCGRESCLPLFALFICFFIVSDEMTTDTRTRCTSTCLSTAVVVYRTRAVNGTGFAQSAGENPIETSLSFFFCFLWSQMGWQQTHVHAVPVLVYLLLFKEKSERT